MCWTMRRESDYGGWTQKGLIVPIGTIDNQYRSEGNSVQCQQ